MKYKPKPPYHTGDARRVLERAIADRVFPGSAVEVGSMDGILWQDTLGTLTFEPNAPAVKPETKYDLASLTKVLATTTMVMGLIEKDLLHLDTLVAQCFVEWRGEDREMVTIRDLLEHTSGLSARLVDPPPEGRREFEHEICTMKLEYPPRTRSIYSDLGFILLGFVISDRASLPFAQLHDMFTVDKSVAAPTMPEADDVRRGRMLVGEVHDNYACALGGAAGHAGLFGTAREVGAMARVWLKAANGYSFLPFPFTRWDFGRRFIEKSTVPGSSRALGWDTMLTTSSCGTEMSPRAFGHVGYTGTSLWIDPYRDRYFVLLTNRACGGGTTDQMRDVRRAFHDALS
ncbi:MAG TPA: serine hydrolase domain-containing protein [Vicinamibacterales bacterium]|nr:serine hydrolase domain-containing protein [Vicinamibacterales bacterium]